MPRTRSPICLKCVHFQGWPPDDDGPSKGAKTCTAYPEGIPREIYFRRYDHRKPFPGDNGIRFEPKEGVDVEAQFYVPPEPD